MALQITLGVKEKEEEEKGSAGRRIGAMELYLAEYITAWEVKTAKKMEFEIEEKGNIYIFFLNSMHSAVQRRNKRLYF